MESHRKSITLLPRTEKTPLPKINDLNSMLEVEIANKHEAHSNGLIALQTLHRKVR